MISFADYLNPENNLVKDTARRLSESGLPMEEVFAYWVGQLEESASARQDLTEWEWLDNVKNWFGDMGRGRAAAKASRENSIEADYQKAMDALFALKEKLTQNRPAELPLIGVVMSSVQRAIKALQVSRGSVNKADELIKHYAGASELSGSRRAMMPTADWQGLKRVGDDPREWDKWYEALKDGDSRKQLIDREAHDRADREEKDKGKWQPLFKRGSVTAHDHFVSDRWYVMDRIRRSVK